MRMLGNVFILGDSYSTFEGYIPDGYEVYYIELHDIDKLYGHPTVKGMQQIKNQVIDYINSNIQH